MSSDKPPRVVLVPPKQNGPLHLPVAHSRPCPTQYPSHKKSPSSTPCRQPDRLAPDAHPMMLHQYAASILSGPATRPTSTFKCIAIAMHAQDPERRTRRWPTTERRGTGRRKRSEGPRRGAGPGMSHRYLFVLSRTSSCR
ncbi:hypothetical protein OF83DRAFT_420896 [Amylostereum chailletii]|nr:hypothetical protein OF83DRAFT_637136 [Amylostereum chailletii]KAI0314706.1 hypothetical protein OF83DRAFT_420896 [Amylostereum chailletii]